MTRPFLLQANSVVSVVIASALLTLGLSGCGQVIDRIQGNDKKESSAAPEKPVMAQPAAPSQAAPSAPKAAPLAAPMTLPTQTPAQTPTKAQAENFNTSSSPIELHPPQQGTSGASKIYRSSDARRP